MSNDAPVAAPAPATDRAGGAVMSAVARLHRAVTGLSGWRRIGVACLLGVVAVAALPPLHIWIALIPAFTGLIWIIEGGRGWRSAFWAGWWFGFGHFTAGLYWIANALLTKPEQFGWLAPFAVIGLSAWLALFPSIAAVVCGFATNVTWLGRVLVFAGVWTIVEWMRSWVLTGFPWNLVGSVWTSSDAMIQTAAAVGTYGLGLITVAAAAMPAVLACGPKDRSRAWMAVVGAMAVLVVCWAGGMVRLEMAGESDTVRDVRLRLVQPNIPQTLKWRRDLVDHHLVSQAEMGARQTADRPTHVIWGETAAPLFLSEERTPLEMIGRMTPVDGLTILGSLRRTQPPQPFEIWNSLFAIDTTGDVVAVYDKFHLVPGGEYIPFRSILDIAKVTPGLADFSPGPGVTTLRLKGLPPVSPLICYEVIFPHQVIDRNDPPQWMVNITNDGWYGHSAGPFQHFAAARLRAVEEGLPLVRVANTGISAIVDSYGRVVAKLGLSERGIVDGPLPVPVETPTIYARFGNWLVLALAVGVSLIGLSMRRRG